MKPFKIRVDWTCHASYGDPVVVELHIMDEEPKVIAQFDTPPEAAGWARKWLDDRGFEFWCNVDMHQRLDHKHITMHPKFRHGHLR